MCGWGPYAREASVWEACCWYSGVINMFLNCLLGVGTTGGLFGEVDGGGVGGWVSVIRQVSCDTTSIMRQGGECHTTSVPRHATAHLNRRGQQPGVRVYHRPDKTCVVSKFSCGCM